MHHRFIVMACAWLVMACAVHADVVERRGTESAVRGRISMVDEAGITINADSGPPMIISWDRVRSVDLALRDPKIDRLMPMAVDLWRARSRIERRDYTLAEPILAKYFDRYRGQTNETALVIMEGLLRCRLARQANDLAVIPALETVRIRRAKQTTNSYKSLPPVLDERTSLCTSLPPAWVGSNALKNLQQDLADYRAKDDALVTALATLYRRAAEHELNIKSGANTVSAGDDQPGVALLKLVVDANSPDEKERTAARDKITKSLNGMPAWAEAWARFAIGQSLLRESGTGRQQAGLVSLIHVPARFGSDQPYLAGLALATASERLESQGQGESAAALRAELQKTYPTHPALAVANARAGSSTTSSPSTKSAS